MPDVVPCDESSVLGTLIIIERMTMYVFESCKAPRYEVVIEHSLHDYCDFRSVERSLIPSFS